MARTPAGNLSGGQCTVHAGAARAAVEPEHEVVSLRGTLGGDEDVVGGDAGCLLQLEVAAEHLELLCEVVVALEGGDPVLFGDG